MKPVTQVVGAADQHQTPSYTKIHQASPELVLLPLLCQVSIATQALIQFTDIAGETLHSIHKLQTVAQN